MIYKCDLKSVFVGGEFSAYSLDNDLHEQALCFIHALDCNSLARLFAIGVNGSTTLYIPDFRASAARSEVESFCLALEDFLSSLDGATFAVAPYSDYMREPLEKLDCSLIFEAQ